MKEIRILEEERIEGCININTKEISVNYINSTLVEASTFAISKAFFSAIRCCILAAVNSRRSSSWLKKCSIIDIFRKQMYHS